MFLYKHDVILFVCDVDSMPVKVGKKYVITDGIVESDSSEYSLLFKTNDVKQF